ncbi:MAG: hypothetical protein ACKO7W_17925 [Elainella sp.]
MTRTELETFQQFLISLRPIPGLTIDTPLFGWQMQFTQGDDGQLQLTVTASGDDCHALVAAIAQFCQPSDGVVYDDDRAPERLDGKALEVLASKARFN